jgi:effector-binding domain-containing protein
MLWRECTQRELSTVIPSATTEVDAALRAAGLKPHDDLVVHYRFLGNYRFDLSVGRPAEGDPPAGMKIFEGPTGRIAHALHPGPYQELEQATDALFRWCREQGYETLTGSWETYHHLEHPDDPSTLPATVSVRLVA